MARRNNNASKGAKAPRRGWTDKAHGRAVRWQRDRDAESIDLSSLAKELGVTYR